MAGTNKIRFMINNRAESILGVHSSEDASFPFVNTQDGLRTKYWKTTGYFNVTATNNQIHFNDNVDRTASVAIAEYTTRAALATAIQTAMNAISSNWLVTHDSTTGFFTVDRSLGVKILRPSVTTNAIWSLIGFTGSTDITAGKADEKRWHEEEHVIWDFGTAVNCTFFAAIHKSGIDFPLSQSGTYKIQGNNINDWTAPPLDETMTVTNDGIFHFMDADINDYRFWKYTYVNNQSNGGADGFPISHIYLGDHRTTVTTNIKRGFNKTSKDRSKSSTSIGGQMFFDKRIKFAEFTNASILHLTNAERDEIETIFDRVGITDKFYVSLDPKLCITSSLKDMTIYARFLTDNRLVHLFKDRFNLTFSIREVI